MSTIFELSRPHTSKEIKVFLTDRSLYGLSVPGSVNVPRYDRISSADNEQT